MRKFLRLFMLILMAAYGTYSWGASIKFKAGKNWQIGENDQTVSHLHVNETDNPEVYSDDFTFQVTDGDLYPHKGFLKSRGTYWRIKKDAYFTISSTKYKIVHISFSFSSMRDGVGDDTHGGERLTCKTVTGTENNGYSRLDKKGGRASDGAWSCPSGSEGYSSVTFRADGGAACDILWVRIFYNDNNGSAGSGDSNGSLYFTGDETFTGSTKVSLVKTGSYGNVKWTRDGTDPNTTKISGSNRGNSVFSDTNISCSYTYKAVASYTTNAHAIDSDVDGEDNSDFTIYATAERHCQKTYSGTKIGAGGYATFCYNDYSWYVPSNMTAWAYTTTATKKSDAPCYLTVSKTYNAGDIIPAGTAVVLKGTANATPTFYNPDMNAAGTKPTSNVLSGNGTGSTLSKSSYNNSNYNFYYLMQEYQNGPWGFFWAAAKGAAVDLKAHMAYLRLSGTQSAKGFVMQMPDDDSTTGIVAIPVGDPTTPVGLDASAPMYNAAGQRVGASYKGIVIQNGRKFVKR